MTDKEPLKLCKDHYYEWMQEGYPITAVEVEDESECGICLQQEWLMNEGKEI